MILRRARALFDRARSELHRSFTEEHSSRETAGSFSLGVFITMLPTLGTGLIAFVVLAWAVSRINRIAMFASVIVFNPVVKWGVYGTSFALGTAILGPVPGVSPSSVSLTAGPAIVARLIVGNLILAVVAAAASYLVAHRIVVAYERRGLGVVDAVTGVVGVDGEKSEGSEGSEDSDGSDRPEAGDASKAASVDSSE
ncbi:DUF2062 domain-containing protein [Halorubrum halophilum]|uniref:DUF2062 domain-containing protein n=1 Tax=Halorubrum halophilum TaxID=413816 RepID=UPI0009E22505|nr:DUF2062 domain-containing protein [Halorubrum halophilum]